MAELPGGTATLLFTDIEASTRLLHVLGPSYQDALATHRDLLREAFSAHDGAEVDTLRETAFFYAFARARDALAGAIQGQLRSSLIPGPRAPSCALEWGSTPVSPPSLKRATSAPMSISEHASAQSRGGSRSSPPTPARVWSRTPGRVAARSGQALPQGHRRPGAPAPGGRSRSEARLRPPRTASSHPTNLPPTLSPLVGRAESITELVSLLAADSRVVTLTGPGGVGKTRVALAAGAEALHSFGDGVFFVDLSALADPALVVGAIAPPPGNAQPAPRSRPAPCAPPHARLAISSRSRDTRSIGSPSSRRANVGGRKNRSASRAAPRPVWPSSNISHVEPSVFRDGLTRGGPDILGPLCRQDDRERRVRRDEQPEPGDTGGHSVIPPQPVLRQAPAWHLVRGRWGLMLRRRLARRLYESTNLPVEAVIPAAAEAPHNDGAGSPCGPLHHPNILRGCDGRDGAESVPEPVADHGSHFWSTRAAPGRLRDHRFEDRARKPGLGGQEQVGWAMPGGATKRRRSRGSR